MTSLSEFELAEMEKIKQSSSNEDGTIDAQKLEEEMLKQHQAKQNLDPVEMAAKMITVYTPALRQRVGTLSSRQLRRVIMSLMEYPLGKEYGHKGVEAEVVAIGRNLQDAKAVLMMDVYYKNAEKIKLEADKLKQNNGEQDESKQ